jgi:hypothetical protein
MSNSSKIYCPCCGSDYAYFDGEIMITCAYGETADTLAIARDIEGVNLECYRCNECDTQFFM